LAPCTKNAAAQWADLLYLGCLPQFWADPSTARRHSLRMVPRLTQTSSWFSSTDWYWELILYSYGKIISYLPTFTVPTHSSAFRRSWPQMKLSKEINSFEIEQRLSVRKITIPFATLRLSNPHWQNTTMCQKELQTSKSETAWLVEDASRKSVSITHKEKDSIFSRIMPEKSRQYRHFTRQNALFEKFFLLLWSRFLVDPLPIFISQ
jgi:hypothetical protein